MEMYRPYRDALNIIEERIREVIEKSEIVYFNVSQKTITYKQEVVDAFMASESFLLPFRHRDSASEKITITREYYDLAAHPGIFSQWPPDENTWREFSRIYSDDDKGDFILSLFKNRFSEYHHNFQQVLENARKYYLFSNCEGDIELIKALIKFYKTEVRSEEVLQIFFKGLLTVNLEISHLFCQGLLLVLEEKISFQLTREESYLSEFYSEEKGLSNPIGFGDEALIKSRVVKIRLPEIGSFESALSLRSLVLFTIFLQKQGVIHDRIKNRHLAIIIQALTSYSSKNLENSQIKELKDLIELIENDSRIDKKEKTKYKNALNEIKHTLELIVKEVDSELVRLGKIKIV